MDDEQFPLTGFSSIAIYAGHADDPTYTHRMPVYATTFTSDTAEQGMLHFDNKDFVFHFTTKFLNGHGTAIGWILAERDIERMNHTILSLASPTYRYASA